jgi:hypothetical protein
MKLLTGMMIVLLMTSCNDNMGSNGNGTGGGYNPHQDKISILKEILVSTEAPGVSVVERSCLVADEVFMGNDWINNCEYNLISERSVIRFEEATGKYFADIKKEYRIAFQRLISDKCEEVIKTDVKNIPINPEIPQEELNDLLEGIKELKSDIKKGLASLELENRNQVKMKFFDLNNGELIEEYVYDRSIPRYTPFTEPSYQVGYGENGMINYECETFTY